MCHYAMNCPRSKKHERFDLIDYDDGAENKSGELHQYTDLQVQTGNNHTNLRFYLTELGEQKAILGYPWFAAAQPKIDWKRGWIDHTQLPIILRANNAKKATFMP